MPELMQIIKAAEGLPVRDTVPRLMGEKLRSAVVYGWHISPYISDPSEAVTYLCDAVGKTPAAMGASGFSYGDWENAFFMPKPCMLRYDGTVAYYLDPNDYTKKKDGTPSDIANPDFAGNAMMEWGMIWYKFEAGESDDEGRFYCSDRKIDDSYHCWCNMDSKNHIIKHFYTAIYDGSGTDRLRSLSGVALTCANGSGNVTIMQDAAKAEENNTTENAEWFVELFSDRQLINALLVLMAKSIDTQSAFGKGRYITSQAEKETYITGALNDKGLFWGDTTGTSSAVKVFGMENWWGAYFRRFAGMLVQSDQRYVKLTCGTADGSAVNGYSFTDRTGYISIPGTHPACGYIQYMTFTEYGMFPSFVRTSGHCFYTDYNAHWTSSDVSVLCNGPQKLSGNGAGYGAFETHICGNAADVIISAALSCKPVRS